MHLYLIRHGACEGMEVPDTDRQLTPEGLADIEKIAQRIIAVSEPPKHLLSSPFKRAVQTATCFQTGWNVSIECHDWLLPSTAPSQVIAQLQAYAGDDCALVGHLPNLGLLLGSLVWGTPAKEVVIPRGGAAHLVLETVEPGTAKLRWLLTPEAV